MAITINGPSKTITVGYDGPITSVSAADLYSAWKDWVAAGNAQYVPAFLESIGGNDIGGGISLGQYVFVNNAAGWRIVPADVDHTLVITGELYPGDPAQAFVSAPATASVLVTMQRSALTSTVATGGVAGPTANEIATEVERRVVPHVWAAS